MLGRCVAKCGKRKLTEIGEARHADADESQRTRALAQCAVEQRARKLADLVRTIDADAHGARSASNREVRVTLLCGHRACRPAGVAELVGRAPCHAPQL